jgi:hypothetical protein
MIFGKLPKVWRAMHLDRLTRVLDPEKTDSGYLKPKQVGMVTGPLELYGPNGVPLIRIRDLTEEERHKPQGYVKGIDFDKLPRGNASYMPR